MNPVMSDLELFVRTHEIEAAAQARTRMALARQASGEVTGRGWARRLVDGLHQFVDPRGFAQAQLRRAEAGRVSESPAVVKGFAGQAAKVAGPTLAATVVELVCDGQELDGEAQVAA